MKMNMGMSFDPRMLGFEFVNTQVVENEVDFLPPMASRHRIQKLQEFLSPLSGKALRLDLTGSHIQGRKKICGSVSFVFVGKPGHRATVGHFQPSLLPFESLNAGLFIHGKDNRVGRCSKVKSDDVRALGVKLRIGRNAPRMPALKAYAQCAQFFPDAGRSNSQGLAKSAPIPLSVSGRWRGVDLLQDLLPETLDILVERRATGTKIISQAHHPFALEPHPPFAYGGRAGPHHGGDLKVAFAAGRFKNNPGPVGMASLGARGSDEFFQFGFFDAGKADRGAWATHEPQYSYFANFVK